MNDKINGICLDGEFYEIVEGECPDCDFNSAILDCREGCSLCSRLKGAYKFSQELTDKLSTTPANPSPAAFACESTPQQTPQ